LPHEQNPAAHGRRVGHTALEAAGFTVIRIKGSHHFLRHNDSRSTVVPVHAGETIGPGLLHKILRDCHLSVQDLQKLL
jgi:predicted RNA binding protein YcfA (HicA-like mRNA interferase family)